MMMLMLMLAQLLCVPPGGTASPGDSSSLSVGSQSKEDRIGSVGGDGAAELLFSAPSSRLFDGWGRQRLEGRMHWGVL